jgi:hypothetical protein
MNPTIEPFLIDAGEAVLLGRTLGEYLEARDDSTWVRFFDFLRSRLAPFYPPVAGPKLKLVDDVDLPRDVEWNTFEGRNFEAFGIRCGFATSCPESWFLTASGSRQATRFTRDRSARRWLPELIAELVAPHVARNAVDDARFNLAIEKPWGQVKQEYLLHTIDGSPCPRSGSEDPERIEKTLSALVARPDNNCSDFFRVGRRLGRVLADCHRYEQMFLVKLDSPARDCDDDELGDDDELVEVASQDEPVPTWLVREWRRGERDQEREERHLKDDDGFGKFTGLEWRESLAESLAELVGDPLLRQFSNAVMWLEVELRTLDKCDDPDDFPTEFRILARIRAAAWLAFGELRHAGGGSDTPAQGAMPAMPSKQMLRLFRLTAESSDDKIRNTLQFWQGELEKWDVAVFPELIVTSLSPGIEALAGRVWPECFTRQSVTKPSVRDVLEQHLRSESESEKRFANWGLMLYKNYRIDAQHHHDAFHCTWVEAVLFFYAIRQLWEWSQEMGQRPSGSSKQLPP